MAASNYREGDDEEMTESPRRNYTRNGDHNMENHTTDRSLRSHREETQPRYLSNLAKGRASSFFINGDAFFPSKKVNYNPSQFKDFHNYLDYLTERLVPRFGAVRKICTPRHGGRILDLEDLQENGLYVVTGNEKFKPYRYDQIRSSDRRKSPPINYNVEPVYHNRQFVSSGKIRKCETQSLLIKVWPNGGDLKGPRRVLISPRIRPYTLANVIAHVNELLKEDCLGTVEKLYFLSGSQVSDVEQIIQNGQYVACRKAERFKKARYNEQAVRNLATSPRLDRKLLAPLFTRSYNGTSQSSTDNSQASTQNSVTSNTHRRRAPDGDDDDDRVFPAKPVKYKRESEKVRTVDLDKDQGRLFRAKIPNHNTRGAMEVPDSRRTKTDLPVDQWDAHEVDEDIVRGRDTKKTLPQRNGYHTGNVESKKSNNKRDVHANNKAADSRAHQMEQSAVKIQASYRGYKARQDMVSKEPQKSNVKKPDKRLSQKNYYERLEEKSEAASKIQAGYRGYQTRKNIDEKHEAATLIQSGYRGHQERKDIVSSRRESIPADKRKRIEGGKDVAAHNAKDKRKATSSKRPASREDSYDELDNESKAAVTIQSHYRGYRARQDMATQRN